MAFTGGEATQVFRTKTPGDYFLARVKLREGGESGNVQKGAEAPYLLIETYEVGEKITEKDPKTGKDVEKPKPRAFLFYDLNALREYDRRARRAKGGQKGDLAAHKYAWGEVTGVNESGYPVWSVKFSDNPADLGEVRKSKPGEAYYVFHEAEREPRQRQSGDGDSTNGPPANGPTVDDDIPF